VRAATAASNLKRQNKKRASTALACFFVLNQNEMMVEAHISVPLRDDPGASFIRDDLYTRRHGR